MREGPQLGVAKAARAPSLHPPHPWPTLFSLNDAPKHYKKKTNPLIAKQVFFLVCS